MYIIIIGFFLRILLATFEIQFQISTLYMPDSLRFHKEAIVFYNYLNNNNLADLINYNWRIGWIYSAFIGFIYYIFTPSLLIGTYFSCIFWFISAILFYKIFLDLKTNQTIIRYYLFAYSFLFPTTIIYSAVILREPLLLLLVNLIVFLIIRIKQEKKNLIYLLSFFATCGLFMVLHKANFIIITIFFISITYIYIIKKINISSNISVFLSFLILIILHFSGVLEYIFERLITYQIGHFGDYDFERAEYYNKNELTVFLNDYSLVNFLIISIKNLFNYLLQPIFLNIGNVKDLILSFENLIRFSLLILILINFFSKYKNNYVSVFSFLLFIINEMTYAQATVNWGTASRHHVPIIGVLLLCSFFSIKKNIK
jgi:hypothetical protein